MATPVPDPRRVVDPRYDAASTQERDPNVTLAVGDRVSLLTAAPLRDSRRERLGLTAGHGAPAPDRPETGAPLRVRGGEVSMPEPLARLRPVLAPVAVVVAVAVTVPPLASDARQDVVVQALQFVVFAAVAPALLVLGLPTWFTRADRPRAVQPQRTDRAGLRVVMCLLPCLALVITWRLPAVLGALARSPALTALELLTLLASGAALWRELTGFGSLVRDPLPRPLRAAMAAVAMWTIWAIAYVTGMSAGGATPAAAGVVRSVADRQLAVAVLWAVPALCYVPVVFVIAMSWFSDRDNPDAEARQMISAAAFPHPGSAARAPRGWRTRGG
ncbi:MAG: cytochrome c oxidase assembly protein [Streptosporangiaceae bacterium]